jgi:23S rRNA (guanosine2251-2'-O)-methyltransferase
LDETVTKQKTEILYGFHPVFEGLKANRRKFFEVYVNRKKISKRQNQIVDLAKTLNIPVKKTSSTDFRSMTGTDMHQGVMAKTTPYPIAGLADIIGKIKSAESPPFLLMLDNILDPHNFGALVRTALCSGVTGVVIPKDRSASPTPVVSKTSAGALEHICLVRVTNMVNTIRTLKEKGLWIMGLDKVSGSSLYSGDLTSPIAIVIGGEEKGIRPLVKKNCDHLISIPQKGPVDSLNASVAGAVVMYEAYRQRCFLQK